MLSFRGRPDALTADRPFLTPELFAPRKLEEKATANLDLLRWRFGRAAFFVVVVGVFLGYVLSIVDWHQPRLVDRYFVTFAAIAFLGTMARFSELRTAVRSGCQSRKWFDSGALELRYRWSYVAWLFLGVLILFGTWVSFRNETEIGGRFGATAVLAALVVMGLAVARLRRVRLNIARAENLLAWQLRKFEANDHALADVALAFYAKALLGDRSVSPLPSNPKAKRRRQRNRLAARKRAARERASVG